MTRPRAGLIPALLLALSGCGNLQTQENGAVDPGRQALPGGLPMSFDRLGDVRVADRRVELPKGRELVRFGLTVVDVGPMHRFVPAHVAEARLVVSSLERASPLAVAGLRPFDVITAVDGQPAASVDDVITRLGAKDEGEQVRLSIVRPGGEATEVVAEAAERVLQTGGFWVPFLAERLASGSGHALGLGPIDSFFYYRSMIDHWAVPAEQPGQTGGGEAASPFPPVEQTLSQASRSRFSRRFEWGTLLNLFFYESEVDLQTGEERSRFRLFWVLSFGDDLVDHEEGT